MTKPLVHLRLFGGVMVERDGRPMGGGRATQRRRLALLTLLAAAPSRRMSRDKLLGYLWPESDTEAARHLLAGAVYELRKALGEKAILSLGDDLALNPEEIETDVARFDGFLERNDRAAAIELYRGPFADGFFVSEAPEFERWVEETRSGYQRTYRDLLEAEGRWQEIVKLDPADSLAALKAMKALNRSGHNAAAIRLGENHLELVRREFGGQPDRDVQSLIEKIRQEPKRDTPPSVEPQQPVVRPAHPMPVRGMIAGFVGGVLVLVLVVIVGIGGRREPDPAILAPGSVLILPFAAPDSQHEPLRYHLATLMSAGLDGAGEIDVKNLPDGVRLPSGTSPSHDSARMLAARAGASGFVLGQVEEVSDNLRLRARLYVGGRDEPLVEAAVTGSPTHVAEAVDQLVLNMLAAWPRAPSERLSGVAARSARSLPAIKAWLKGEQEYQAGHFLAASEAFAQSVEADSAFAMGYHRLSHARLAADFPETRVVPLDNRASELSAGLAERDRMLIRAYTHFRNGEAESAEQRYQSLVNLYPDDVEAWTGLGETRFHYNPLRGLPVTDALQAFEKAAEINPGNWTVQWHLAHLAALTGDRDEFVRIIDRLLARNPENATRQDLSYLRALALNDRTTESRLTTEIANADELRLVQLIWRSAVFLKDLDGAERIARVLAEPSRPPYPRMLGLLSLVYLDLARGNWSGAEEHLRTASTLQGVQVYVLDTRVAMALLPNSPATPDALRALRDSIVASAVNADSLPPQETRLAAMLSSAIGDSSRALHYAARLERRGDITSHFVIQADLAFRAGRMQQALDLLRRMPNTSWYGYYIGAPLGLLSHARYLQAEALRGLGRNEEAEGWYRSLKEFALADLVYQPVN